jgi:hypothetical protein
MGERQCLAIGESATTGVGDRGLLVGGLSSCTKQTFTDRVSSTGVHLHRIAKDQAGFVDRHCDGIELVVFTPGTTLPER